MEAYLNNLLQGMVLEKKKEELVVRHGSRKDDEIEYYTYYDINRGVWTTYNRAVEGYVLEKLKPIISELLKEI